MEWLTGTVFKVDTATLRNFTRAYHFDTLYNLRDIELSSRYYLHSHKPAFTSTKNIYFIRKSQEKNNWTYVADLNSGTLWAEIWYPDGGQ